MDMQAALATKAPCSTDRNRSVGIDVRVEAQPAKKVAHQFPHSRQPTATTNHHNVINILRPQVHLPQRLHQRHARPLQKLGTNHLQILPAQH
mmetsp:Transcript_11744/g.21204  ORF Transcript_11744/g.21204 Transcript_11744/m.21204 type:complete len:92 (-) Transcript_11744:1193-1468(-)